MKIIVDKMPNSAEDCVFGTGDDMRCVINNRMFCKCSMECEYLKPITDFHAVEHMGNNITRMIPIE